MSELELDDERNRSVLRALLPDLTAVAESTRLAWAVWVLRAWDNRDCLELRLDVIEALHRHQMHLLRIPQPASETLMESETREAKTWLEVELARAYVSEQRRREAKSPTHPSRPLSGFPGE